MRLLLALLLALFGASAQAQFIPFGSVAPTGGGGCNLNPGTYTNIICVNFSADPIGTFFSVATAAGYAGVQGTTTGADSSPTANKGIAIDTLNSYTANQKAAIVMVLGTGGTPGVSGPIVRGDLSGNGYLYIINLGEVHKLIAGAGGTIVVSGCPTSGGGTSGDVFELQVSSTTLTCRDVTLGTSATGSDSSYSTGLPGFLIDSSGGTHLDTVARFGAS